MMESFKKEQGINLKGQDLKYKFYKSYFGNICEENGIELTKFLNSRNTNSKDSKKISIFMNKQFIKNINLNPEFVSKIKNLNVKIIF